MGMLYNTATPDSVYIFDENGNELIGYYYVQMDCRPVPFARGMYGEVIIGEVGQGHAEVERDYCMSLGTRYRIHDEGRFWNDTYVTAWGLSAEDSKNIERARLFYKSLYRDMIDQKKFDIGDYIILLEKHDDYAEYGCYVMCARVRDFIQNGKLTEYTKFMSGDKNIDFSEPFKPTDGTPDMPRTRLDRERLWKYGWVAEEKLNEENVSHVSPDLIYLLTKNGKQMLELWFDDPKSKPLPFIIANGKAYIGKMGDNHPRMAYELKQAGTPIPYDEYEIRGRLYKGKYIITWTGYDRPEGAREQYKIIRDVLLKYGIDVTDYIAFFQTDWGEVLAIRVREYLNGGRPMPYLQYFAEQRKKKKEIPTAPNGMSTTDFWRHYQMVGEGVEEHELNQPWGTVHGNPDNVYLPDRNREKGIGFTWNLSDDNPVTFLIADGKLFVGNEGEVHDDLRKKIRNSGGSNLRWRGDPGQIEGRIYNNEYVALWTYIDPDNIETQQVCKEIIRLFDDRALRMRANAFSGDVNGPVINNIGNMTILFEPEYGSVFAANLKNYAATGKYYPYLDYIFPEVSDSKKDIERKEWEKNQWRHYQMVGEQAMKIVKKILKEEYSRFEIATPDCIKLFPTEQSNYKIYMVWHEKGAWPFIISDAGRIYMGDEGMSHYDIEQRVEDELYGEGIRGRIYDKDGYQVFMLWNYYTKPFERKTIEVYKYVQKALKLKEHEDISDMITFFQSRGEIFAITVRDYIAGKTPVNYKRFFDENEKDEEIPSSDNGMNPKDIWRHYQFVGEQIAKHILQEMKKRSGK